jgi:hypothetical protein
VCVCVCVCVCVEISRADSAGGAEIEQLFLARGMLRHINIISCFRLMR